VTAPQYRVIRYAEDADASTFDCGVPASNTWLQVHAGSAVSSRSSMVYLLTSPTEHRVLGYYAIAPTLVARNDLPGSVGRGVLNATPAWILTKLALDRSLRGDPENQWGRQLLRDALERIVEASDLGGGQVIVVDAGHPGLVPWYVAHGFTSTGAADHRLYLKVSTARRSLT